MNIKHSIAELAVRRGRAVAKSDAIYDSKKEASEAESRMSAAKNAPAFEKAKKASLSSVNAGNKAVKAWQREIDAWETSINALEKEIAAETDKIKQQKKEAAAGSKAIDEINAKTQAYNDSLLLGKHDPRYRPLILKNNASVKLLSAEAALHEPAELAKYERGVWQKQQKWVGAPIKELKAIKSRVSKAKFAKK